uniref:Pectate lyase n=1 Tax=Colletotrichum fructicola (strain Nara gc5) TaxID=1213859 RepID=L2FBN5_COLFN
MPSLKPTASSSSTSAASSRSARASSCPRTSTSPARRRPAAAQRAPGGGITVYGNGFSWSNANNAIVRYIRIRMGKGGDSGKDAITIADGNNMIFDHVSVSWGRDETFSINGEVSNVTISDSIIAQGLETHSCGGLMQTNTGGVSLFRNAYIDNKTRNPKVKGVNDFQNNVVYNWGGGGGYIAGDSDGASYANIINNYFISGPSTSVTAFTRGNANFRGYVKNNFYDSNKDGVGASIARDAVDAALVKQIASYGKSGALISDEATMGGVGTIEAGTAKKDTDGDGIPDEYETANGLNANDKSDGMKIGAGGYTNLEIYVNSLAPAVY